MPRETIGHANARPNQPSVLVSDAYAVEGPKNIIPFQVWAVPSNHLADLERDILAIPGSLVVKIALSLPEGEVSMERGDLTRSPSGSVAGMVESGPQVIDGIANNFVQTFRERMLQSQFPDVLARSVRVVIHKRFVEVLLSEELVCLGIKLGKVLLCPRNFPATTFE